MTTTKWTRNGKQLPPNSAIFSRDKYDFQMHWTYIFNRCGHCSYNFSFFFSLQTTNSRVELKTSELRIFVYISHTILDIIHFLHYYVCVCVLFRLTHLCSRCLFVVHIILNCKALAIHSNKWSEYYFVSLK